MKSIKSFFSILLLMIIISCNNQKETTTKAALSIPDKDNTITKAIFTPDMVQNKKDFSCGMSVKSGIEDTCYYKGNVYGFCSTECKQEFLKSPASYLSKK